MTRTVAGHGGGPGRRGLAVQAGMLLLSAACGLGPALSSGRVPADLTESEVVGSWQEARAGAVLTFTDDGKFEAGNLPYQEIAYGEENLPPGFDPKRDLLPASGDWYLDTGFGGTDGPRSTVTLGIRELAGRPAAIAFSVDAEREDEAVVLVIYLGDPDANDRIVYERCPGLCSAVSPAPS